MSLLTGFTAGLLLITLSELGDKTFFITAILAMRHPRRWVFVGASAALFTMTVLSVLLGQVVAVFPQRYVESVAAALFIGLGLKLLYDALKMSGGHKLAHEQADAQKEVEQREKGVMVWSVRAVVLEAFTLVFVGEWGDRTQLATITLAAANHPLGVVVGATLGHAICAAIAVACGKLLVGRISERLLVSVSGALFIFFGMVTVINMS
ncbi:MAG: putative membrane protein [Phormidesmis priestleyi Ana]|uniref:GDT1 family protein n=1 Tax=Phormidesmis priestleyi Ana TaxID=1666911 RepID=A0A0P8BMN7_9CYAN|nr:MAG: putative membrane protein [Phormidesmis priestleyi Ana]